MKKKNIVDVISLKMMSRENDAFDYSEDDIWKDIVVSGDIMQKGRDGRTYLIHAIAYKRHAIVKKLLKTEPSLIHVKDEDLGYTPLHVAISVKDEEMVKLLLKHKAEVNAVDNYGNTPLLRASHLDKNLIKILISFGADPSIKNRSGISACDAFAAYPDIMKLLKKE